MEAVILPEDARMVLRDCVGLSNAEVGRALHGSLAAHLHFQLVHVELRAILHHNLGVGCLPRLELVVMMDCFLSKGVSMRCLQGDGVAGVDAGGLLRLHERYHFKYYKNQIKSSHTRYLPSKSASISSSALC